MSALLNPTRNGVRPFVLISDPVRVPLAAAEIAVIYDIGAILDLTDEAALRALWGPDLRARDFANARARQAEDRAWRAAYPRGDADCTTAAEYAAFDAARAAHETAQDTLTAEAGALVREVTLRVIAAVVIRVEGADDPAPVPDVPASWDAWPTPVLQWVANQGRALARVQVQSEKKSR